MGCEVIECQAPQLGHSIRLFQIFAGMLRHSDQGYEGTSYCMETTGSR